MTVQEVFDAVCRHAAQMKRQSVMAGGTRCMYRGACGERCFVGALIRDEEYNPKMDDIGGNAVSGLIAKGWLPARLIEHEDLLCRLQHVHDSVPRELWADRLALAARAFKLDPSAANNVGVRWAT